MTGRGGEASQEPLRVEEAEETAVDVLAEEVLGEEALLRDG
jgi:hypothetical protein